MASDFNESWYFLVKTFLYNQELKIHNAGYLSLLR